jgi:hypothetical protein
VLWNGQVAPEKADARDRTVSSSLPLRRADVREPTSIQAVGHLGCAAVNVGWLRSVDEVHTSVFAGVTLPLQPAALRSTGSFDRLQNRTT